MSALTDQPHRSALKRFLRQHHEIIVVLAVGAVLWAGVFVVATQSFGGTRPFRAVWNGMGTVNVFGYQFDYDLEGWSDYDYYYVTWGLELLQGRQLYSPEFGAIETEEGTYNAPYFFPPLFAYMCALGVALPIQPYGIGLLITLCGYLTAIPIYGIAHSLSRRESQALLATLIYLFNPLVLYYTAFEWLNSAPFTFFGLLGLYLMMRDHRLVGAATIVVSALFKQTGFFLIVPLLAYAARPSTGLRVFSHEKSTKPVMDWVSLRNTMLVVVVVSVLLSLPYIVTDPVNYLFYLFVRPGTVWIDVEKGLPSRQMPTTIVYPLIAVGAPLPVLYAVNVVTYYGFVALLGILVVIIFQLVRVTLDWSEPQFSRKTFLLLVTMYLWVHLWSPRGIYKYYCVTLVVLLAVWSAVESADYLERGHEVGWVVIPLLVLLWSLLILFTPRWFYIVLIGLAALVVPRKYLFLWCRALVRRIRSMSQWSLPSVSEARVRE